MSLIFISNAHANENTLKIAISTNMSPYSFINEKNKADGILVDYWKLWSKKTNTNIKFIPLSLADTILAMRNKSVHIHAGLFKTKESSKYINYLNKIYNVNASIYINRNDKNRIKTVQDLKNKTIGVIKDSYLENYIKKNHSEIEIYQYNNYQTLQEAIRKGNIDSVITDDLVVRMNIIRHLDYKQLSRLKSFSLHNWFYTGIIIGDKNLQRIVLSGMNKITDNDMLYLEKKWLTPKNIKKKINIAFGKGREPYAFNKNYLKGIEHDLVDYILNKSNITINSKTYLSMGEMASALDKYPTLDIAVSVKKKNKQFYYSNDFINFENIAISRIEDNLFIDNIKDLKSKKITAFLNAHQYLGDEFEQMFNLLNRDNNYNEQVNQKKQVQDFLDKKTDIIIIDINIFKWHLKKLSSNSVSKYKFDFIFPNKNNFKVAFKDKRLRDTFNTQLEFIKQSGQYQKIINNYIENDIEAKIKINSLISTVISKSLYEEDKKQLKEIITNFSSLPYIEKIEVFDNNKKLFSESSDKKLNQFTRQDSFYVLSNIPRKVGYIKVFFNEDKLKISSSSNHLIPELFIFENLDSYKYIRDIYKRFNYINNKFKLSKKEKEFISKHPVISYSALNREPISIVENGTLKGLITEYIKIIEEKTGLSFIFEQSESWSELNEKFENMKIDLFPSIENLKYLDIESSDSLESNIITYFHFGIITDKDGVFADKISDLRNKTIALVKHSPSFHLIKRNLPDIQIIETMNVKESLSMVSQGKAYAFVGPTEISTHYIREFFPELKMVGITEDKLLYHFLIQNNYPELLSIINKVLNNISPDEQKRIRNKWIKEEINIAIDYTLVYQILLIFTLILFIIFIFMKKLSTAKTNIELTNGKLALSNQALKTTIKNLKEAQEQLLASEKMAALGGLVAGVAHEINTPVGIGLTGITHLEDSTKDIVAKYKNNNLSQEEFDEYLSVCNELTSLVHKNLKKAAQLVKSFKQVAVDQSSEEQRTFNFNEYLNEILASIHSLTKKTLIKINIDCPKNIVVTSYPGALSQVITNLIMNSIIHGFDKNETGNILITIEKENNAIKLIYKDNGKGISKDNFSKIFNPFFTTKRNSGGSGLGLNIIYNIIKTTLKGTISCESKENSGTKFIIKFKV